jgi:hypothetical protein
MPDEWENAKKPVPKGVYPIFLTMTTQEKFGCKENVNVSQETPYVAIAKQVFLDDIQFRGVISDFHPTKKFIEKYPEDELLVVWDEEEDYGQNYYLIHSLDEKAKFLAAREKVEEVAAAEAKAADPTFIEEYKAPESKEWVTQGADAELAEEVRAPARPLPPPWPCGSPPRCRPPASAAHLPARRVRRRSCRAVSGWSCA